MKPVLTLLLFAASLSAQSSQGLVTIVPGTSSSGGQSPRIPQQYIGNFAKMGSYNGGQYFSARNNSSFNFTAVSFTVCIWYTATEESTGQDAQLVGKDAATTGWSLWNYSNTQGSYIFAINGFTPFVVASTYGAVQPTIPTLVCGYHDQANALIGIAINNLAADETPRATAPVASTGDLFVGNSAPVISGGVGRLMIFTGVLTPAQRIQLYNGGSPLRYADIRSNYSVLAVSVNAWWNMDENNGTRFPVFDSTAPLLDLPPLLTQPSTNSTEWNEISPQLPTEHRNNWIAGGDSITYGSFLPRADTYPAQLWAHSLKDNWLMTNTGVSGTSSTTMLASQVPLMGAYATADVQNVCSVDIGINDLAAGVALATIEANITSIVTALQGFGCITGVSTLTPTNFPAYCDATCQANRLTLNTWILANTAAADFTVDLAGDVRLQNPNDAACYSDKLHPTALCAGFIAEDWASAPAITVIPVNNPNVPNFRLRKEDYISQVNNSGGAILAHRLVKWSGGAVVQATTADTTGAMGFAVNRVPIVNAEVEYITKGRAYCEADGGAFQAAVGDLVMLSNVTGGACKTLGVQDCSYLNPATQIVGRVLIPNVSFAMLVDVDLDLRGCYVPQAVVTTQFDKTSSTALANVPGLTKNLLIGKTYTFTATLFTTSNVLGGVQAAIGGTATATSIIYEGESTAAAAIGAQTRATALGTSVAGITAVTAARIDITGTIVVSASGTLTVQFAQNASNAAASSVLVGSSFTVNPVN